MTHLSINVIIYQVGLSVRHPKGARSIGIGHPRSGDRCAETRPYPIDPLRVAEQGLPPTTPQGCRTIKLAGWIYPAGLYLSGLCLYRKVGPAISGSEPASDALTDPTIAL